MNSIKLFLCGDVMTGRGIDQILPHPSDPTIHEGYLDSALGYVRLAEGASGPIPRAVADSYIWGDALGEFERVRPKCRVINLETAVTRSEDWAPKGINYRMSPANIGCLTAAAIDCCALANNHVLDWGAGGLVETLDTLEAAGLRTAGAGKDPLAAEAPAIIPVTGAGRVLVFSVGVESSGVPRKWAATADGPGVAFLPDLSQGSVEALTDRILRARRPGDVVILSIHWGANWSYEITPEDTGFARALVDAAAVDVIHGHSSHHPKAVEVYRDRLILYGCGDFINDYEGITGHEEFRGELGLMYFPTLQAGDGRLLRLELVATRMKCFRARRAAGPDTRWLCATLDREGLGFGTRTRLLTDGRIELNWKRQ